MNSVLLAKYLYNKARAEYSPADTFSYGLTVSLLQDSAEMLVWEMAKHFSIQSKPTDGFVKLVQVIDQDHGGIDLKQQIFELNTARVGFKHFGNIPLGNDVVKFISNCEQFLTLNAGKIGVDFSELSVADSVSNSEIRKRLKNSEKLLEQEMLQESLIQSSLAFKELENAAYSSVELNSFDLNEIKDAYYCWPESQQCRAREFTEKLAEVLEGLTRTMALTKLGTSAEEVMAIKGMCYIVHVLGSGETTPPLMTANSRPEKDRIRLINDFIVDASKKI